MKACRPFSKRSLAIVATRVAATALTLALTAPAYAVDTDPGDYTALPDGANAFLLYGQYAQRNAAYADGTKVPISPSLKSEVGIARFLHVVRIDDRWTVDPNVLLPFGHLKASGDVSALGSASGVGDLILAPAFKYKVDPASGETFGFTPYVFVPTGTYHADQPLNLGEHRWKLALQAAYTRPLAPKWRWDAVADVTFHGDNDKCRAACGSATDLTLKRDALYELQGHLRYEASAALFGAVSLTHSWGGESHVGDTPLGDRVRTTAVRFTGAYFIASNTQLLATLARDLAVENGLRENVRVNLRVLYLF